MIYDCHNPRDLLRCWSAKARHRDAEVGQTSSFRFGFFGARGVVFASQIDHRSDADLDKFGYAALRGLSAAVEMVIHLVKIRQLRTT
jgi:hypothetical protein